MMVSDHGDHEAVLSELFAKRPSVIKTGLERMQRAFEELGLAASLPPCVLIAGTNGKGSTAGMLWHLLAALGLRAGLYTSPHLVHFRERIQCSHALVSDELILATLHELQTRLRPALYGELSFFEVTTLMALMIFREQACDVLVLEVGLGGRWDATNIVQPVASAVVSIDFDHQAWLGSTLGEIAREKLGVARRGRPLYWGERQTATKAGIAASLDAVLEATGCQLNQVGQHFRFDPATSRVELELPGLAAATFNVPRWVREAPPAIQHNFAISLALFFALLHHHTPLRRSGLPDELCQTALAKFAAASTPWPHSLLGRFQRLDLPARATQRAHSLLLDVSHNLASTQELIDSLRKSGILGTHQQQIPALVSILADKDVNGILDLLRPVASPLVLFQVESSRSLQAENLAPRHKDLRMFADFAKAWDYAYKDGSELPQPWLVCGSFLAVGEVINHFSAFPAQQHFRATLTGHWPDHPHGP